MTSALPGKVERMLAGLSVSNPFECMVTADLVTNGKPDPECYLLAAEKLGIDPESMIVFEDSVSGVKSASDAGATVIGVNEDSLTDPLKNAGAVMVQTDFTKAALDSEGEEMFSIALRGKSRVSFKISVGY